MTSDDWNTVIDGVVKVIIYKTRGEVGNDSDAIIECLKNERNDGNIQPPDKEAIKWALIDYMATQKNKIDELIN